MIYNYTGIILEKYDVGETDRIYTIYTLEAGKIRAIAKGVKRARAKLAGCLENFTLVNVSVAKRLGTGRITGVVVENNFPCLKNNFELLAKSFEAAKIFNKLVGMEEKDRKVFNLTAGYLNAMNIKKDLYISIAPNLITQGFIFKLFNCLGYKIEAGVCVRCGKPLSREGNYFSAEQGGILCGGCSSGFKNKIKASANTIKIIRIFFKNDIKSLAKLRVEPKDINDLKTISGEFFRWIV